jgi:hypothetical protein
MAELNPAATHHLPSFIAAPGETDVLMVIMSVVLLGAVVGFGILFLRLHALPEQIAHRSHKLQFELVAVLCLIALFTHMHIFWIAGLLLAMVDLPDFGNSLGRIAGSVEKMAGLEPGGGMVEVPPASHGDSKLEAPAADAHGSADVRQQAGPAPVKPKTAEVVPVVEPKERIHA